MICKYGSNGIKTILPFGITEARFIPPRKSHFWGGELGLIVGTIIMPIEPVTGWLV